MYFVFSVTDMPGPALRGRAARGGSGRGPDRQAVSRETDEGRVFLGFPATRRSTMPRSRAVAPPSSGFVRAAAVPRPELSAAFDAAGGEDVAARLLILPSADSRRVLEEMVPAFPAELGGGPMTDLTQGMLWAALGLEAAPQASLRLVVESKNAAAARALERLTHHGLDYLGRSPDLQKLLPELPRILANVKPSIDGSRITIDADAKQAASLVNSIARPARQVGDPQSVRQQRKTDWPGDSQLHREPRLIPTGLYPR